MNEIWSCSQPALNLGPAFSASGISTSAVTKIMRALGRTTVDEPISGGTTSFVPVARSTTTVPPTIAVNQKETTTALARVEIIAARLPQGVLSAHCSMTPGA
jgi:hypothetical protein